MFGSQILEVVIGLVLIYLALSIGCSGIKEVIAGAFSMRSRTLEKAVRNMLKNGPNDYTAKLFAHPLITGTAPEGEKPSYISSRMFAAALLDVVAPAEPNQPRTMDSLRAGVAQMPDAKLRSTLLNFIDAAGGDMDAARRKIADWFDDTMARVSGWYKRTAQEIIFAVGLTLCIAVNADTLMIVKELWSDQALRNAVVAQAVAKVQATSPADFINSKSSLQQVAGEIREVNTPPIGWSRDARDIRAFPKDLGAGALKLLGMLLSSFAIVMGAPFWFDMLNKFINLRSSGSPPTTH
ncbi:MAG TPA: hypothetical protein VMI32_13110 [Candidatus Solibacter sp.]|nr:hypothetical protein [Candidatus Solibacter sp.]